MNIVLLGMPGAGKGTVATWLKEERGCLHISTGDVLRNEVAAGTDLGKKVQDVMNQGGLVSDEMMIDILKKHLSVSDKTGGVIFDGFPRTTQQAQALEEIVTIDQVVFLKVDEEIVVKRIVERAEESGEKREDDSEEVIRKRIATYYENTKPLIDYYQGKNLLIEIDGGQAIAEVRDAVAAVL